MHLFIEGAYLVDTISVENFVTVLVFTIVHYEVSNEQNKNGKPDVLHVRFSTPSLSKQDSILVMVYIA
jgi:hypothetical protein